MADEVTYQAPIGGRVLPGTQRLEPMDLVIRRSESYVEVLFVGDNGVRQSAIWEGAEADALIQQMNTMDFRTVSLRKRLCQQALADGKITLGGTVT